MHVCQFENVMYQHIKDIYIKKKKKKKKKKKEIIDHK